MLRTQAGQVSLWEAVLPVELLRLPAEQARVDALLEDPAFLAPFVPFFDPRLGRPSTPMETYLRMMFLKSRYRLGFETLCREVSDSITWRFSPDPAGRAGAASDHADEADHPLRGSRGGRVQRGAAGQGCAGHAAARRPGARGHHGGAGGGGLPDRFRAAGQGGAADRRDRAADPGRGWGHPHPGTRPQPGRRRGRLRRAVDDLAELLQATRAIAAQTRQRVAGITPPGATRRVSLHDGDARPIAKGRLGKPVEFGYKAQVVDNDDGVVPDHTVAQGNPPDAPQLVPAIERVIARTGRRPRVVTADRGYGEKRVEDDLHRLGVRTVVIPRKGKPGKARQATEHRPAFRRTVKWRTGSEGRISSLKRGYGWDRTRLDGIHGARIWTGQAVLAHNLVKIAALTG
jgi:transposase, IS5 family